MEDFRLMITRILNWLRYPTTLTLRTPSGHLVVFEATDVDGKPHLSIRAGNE